jgi:hypothetical protein
MFCLEKIAWTSFCRSLQKNEPSTNAGTYFAKNGQKIRCSLIYAAD